MKPNQTAYFYWLLALLTVKTLIAGAFILVGNLGLGPDEAQYWTWSQELDVGYYSKPPGIAWQIAFGTFLFGNTPFGVRFASLVIGFLLPLTVYFLGKSCCLQPRSSFWAALIMAFSPLGILASLLAITDGGMVLFWALATFVICRSLHAQRELPYYWIGFLVLCGALFKWPMYLFWIFVAGWELFRRKSLSWPLLGGIAISLLGLLPSFIWNIQHDYATFRHVFSTIHGSETVDVGTTTLLKGNLLEFIGAQSLLISPILFFCLVIAFWVMIQKRKELNETLLFCGFSSLVILLSYALYSILKKMQGNWCDFAYPAACVLISWWGCEYSKKGFKWLAGGVISSVILVVTLFFFPQPFKHNVGWTKLDKILTDVGYDPAHHFLFSDKYQITSLLSFYGPKQKRAYFLNLHRIRKNQFSYWPGMEEEQAGKDGYFVVAERTKTKVDQEAIEKRYQEILKPYFSKVQYLGTYPLILWNGTSLKQAYVFKGVHYNGQLPSETTLY
ncbi:MAG: ArnT family glycosyltransferase [Parachlamydiaceae bacterium]